MTNASLIHDTARLRALAAQGRLWLCELLAWLADLFGAGPLGRAVRAEVRRDLTRLRQGVTAIIALLALPLAQARAPMALGERPTRPAHAPPGFRRGARCSAMRAAMRLAKRRRAIRAEVGALTHMLDALDHWVERMARRLVRVLVDALVIVVAAVEGLACQAVPAVQPPDTS